jgi:aminoglycoside/choline kinase family phosphotransferase
MTDRATQSIAFLAETPWHRAQRSALAGDASNRRYERLALDGHGTAVLMDAPPAAGEDVRRFADRARHLCGIGLSAPRILAEDEPNGFLLIEDLGDDLFARVLRTDPHQEATLYSAAVDVLVHLHHQSPPPGLDHYDARRSVMLSALAYDWYFHGIKGAKAPSGRDAFIREFLHLLEPLDQEPPVLIQRDYHAENLLWLPQRDGVAQVGLLDFQDAMLGHPAYDLVSVLQDARRDVSPDIETKMIRRFLSQSRHQAEAFDRAYHVLSLQRNLRILGVFARLCLRDGKAHYIDLIPRVWGHIERSLSHPALARLRPQILRDLPHPTPQNLTKLKSQCAQHPDP